LAATPTLNADETAERALSLFYGGFNCSQSSFTALREAFDAAEVSPAIGICFGGGMGRSGGPCGILTGALMAAGLIHGPSDPDDSDAKATCYDLTLKLIEIFEEHGGAVNCSDLTGRAPGGPLPENYKEEICAPLMRSFVTACYEAIEAQK